MTTAESAELAKLAIEWRDARADDDDRRDMCGMPRCVQREAEACRKLAAWLNDRFPISGGGVMSDRLQGHILLSYSELTCDIKAMAIECIESRNEIAELREQVATLTGERDAAREIARRFRGLFCETIFHGWTGSAWLDVCRDYDSDFGQHLELPDPDDEPAKPAARWNSVEPAE